MDSLLQPGMTEHQVERAMYAAGLRGASPFLTEQLFPLMKQKVLDRLSAAQTAEDLWQVKGEYRLLREMEQHARGKMPNPNESLVR